MIFGIGSDLVERDRIAKIELSSRGGFSKKILGSDEYLVYQFYQKKSEFRAVAYLAKRFAAKEAFSKAVGTGIRFPVIWRNIQTISDAKGKPTICLGGDLANWVEKRKLNFFITLSDTRQFAIAFVLAIKNQ